MTACACSAAGVTTIQILAGLCALAWYRVKVDTRQASVEHSGLFARVVQNLA